MRPERKGVVATPEPLGSRPPRCVAAVTRRACAAIRGAAVAPKIAETLGWIPHDRSSGSDDSAPMRTGTGMLALICATVTTTALIAPQPPAAAVAKKKPNLVISRLTAASSAPPGAPLRVALATRNSATAGSGRSVTRLLLSADTVASGDDAVLASIAVAKLGAGAARRASVTITTPATAGSFHLLACADATKRVKESQELDNCRATVLAVVAPVPPVPPVPSPTPSPSPSPSPSPGTSYDLQVSAVSAAPVALSEHGGPGGAPGGTAEISLTVTNAGPETASGIVVKAVAGNGEGGGTVPSTTIPSLAAGHSVTLSLSSTFSESDAHQSWTAQGWLDLPAADLDPSNDAGSAPLELSYAPDDPSTLPDLAVTDVRTTRIWTEGGAESTGTATVSATISNLGGAAVCPGAATAIAAPGPAPTLADPGCWTPGFGDSLAPGDSVTIERALTWTGPIPPTQQDVWVCATAGNWKTGPGTASADADHANDCGSSAVTFVDLTQPPPAVPGAGGEFPHTPAPLSVTPAPTGAPATYGYDPAGGTQTWSAIPVATGITASIEFPAGAFGETHDLSATPLTLPDAPLTVLGAVDIDPADPSEGDLQSQGLLRIRFSASSPLAGTPVLFSAAADGSQLHLVPLTVAADGTWSTSALATSLDHLGILGIGTVTSAQLSALEAGWPSYDDFQLEAAQVPASLAEWATKTAAARSVAAASRRAAAVDPSDTTWADQQIARLDAYYNDVVIPSFASAYGGDLAEITAAAQVGLSFGRQVTLLGLDDTELGARSRDLWERIGNLIDKAADLVMADCRTHRDIAANREMYQVGRQLALMGHEDKAAQLDAVIDQCDQHQLQVDVHVTRTYDLTSTGTVSGPYTDNDTWRDHEVLSLHFDLSGDVYAGSGGLARWLDVGVSAQSHRPDYGWVGGSSCSYLACYTDITASTANVDPHGSTTPVQCRIEIDQWKLDVRGHQADPRTKLTCSGLQTFYADYRSVVHAHNGDVWADTTTSEPLLSGPLSDPGDFSSWGALTGTMGANVSQRVGRSGTTPVPTKIVWSVTEVSPGG